MGQCCISTVCITKFLEMFSFVSINILKKPYRGIFRVFLPCKLRMVKKRNYKEVSSEVQRSIVAEHLYGVRGYSTKALANKYNLPKSTVRNILNRAHENRGDPVRPRGHNKRKLTTAGQHKLFNTLDRKPWATNRKLAVAVGHRIGPRSVGNY